MEILKDKIIVEILGCCHRSLIPFYQFYADRNTMLINFDSFSRFCTDFEIFPDILSKPKIMKFFKTLSGFFETTANCEGEESARKAYNVDGATLRRDVIDEHLFVEALALAAFEINYTDPQPTNAQKIILLMERLNHSEGPAKVQKAMGRTRFVGAGGGDGCDLLYFIR